MEIDDIVSIYAQCCGISTETITGPSKKSGIVTVRHLIWRTLHNEHYMTLTDIGGYFNRHHATILSGIRRADGLITVADRATMYFMDRLRSAGTQYAGIPILPHIGME